MGFGKRIDQPGGHWHAVREAMMIRAVMITMTDTVGVDLLDLSRSGVKLRGADLPAPGQEVVLLLGRFEAFGSVVWRDEGQCGVHFDIALSEQALAIIESEREPASRAGLDGEAALAACDWLHGLAR
ncbi:MAG: PilZ domain-containing protein [Pseudomonadota bacterium]|nr:PilZ domain-containing protein [Pseudomonadota bacterium]